MAPSPPSESQILTSYLLHPSTLSIILPYSTFLTLLPSHTSRRHPDLRRLYHDLQFQRDITIDDVRRRIENECHRSVGLAGRLSRQIRKEEDRKVEKGRKRRHDDDDDDAEGENGEEEEEEDHVSNYNHEEESASGDETKQDLEFDTTLHGGPLGSTIPTATSRHNHTISSLLSTLSTASADLESEIADLEASIEELRVECEEIVGNLSDLRYGRFTNGAGGNGRGVEDEVASAVEALKDALEREGGKGSKGDGD